MGPGRAQLLCGLLVLGAATAWARTMPLHGVVEGYHGAPWSGDARRDVITFLGARGMNAFVYGPKDDPFRRSRWRDPYPADALADLGATAAVARRARVSFVYALSPGLDACYGCGDDFRALTRKLRQLARDARIRRFALFFDAGAGRLGRPEDVARYGGSDATALARAQADLVNRVERWLAHRHLPALAFLVPTGDAGTACGPYHAALAAGLQRRLPIAWTGRGTFSRTLTAADARARQACLGGHPVVLWDNFPVNDTLLANTLHLGPLAGRDADLPAALAGYLLNPMTQARASLIGLGTAAAYLAAPEQYAPEDAWRAVLAALDPSGHLAVLAEQTRGSPLDDPHYGDARALDTAVAAIARDWGDAAWMPAVEGLEAELHRQADAAAALGADPQWAELSPWIAELAAHTAAGLDAARLLRAMKPGLAEVTIGADGVLRGRVLPPDTALVATLAPTVTAPHAVPNVGAYLACLGDVDGAPSGACTPDAGRACDGGPCCSVTGQFVAPGTVCRAAAGPCDVAEVCSGASASCPPDGLAATGTTCRRAAGPCDVAESCTGAAPACPADGFATAGTPCGDGDVCNGAETCRDGGSCAAGAALACDDGNGCTDDTCAPTRGCMFTDNGAPCGDGIACTADVCAHGSCRSTPACGGGGTCNLATGACDPPPGGYRLWPDEPVPATTGQGDDAPVELGVRFEADVPGFVTGIRFHKSADNTGLHVGNLWSRDGRLLGRARFTTETPSGWQEATFPQPVAIEARTPYVASYHCPTGHYDAALDFFSRGGFDNSPLHALRDGVEGRNGVFAYGAASAMPTASWRASNYWVDPVFTTTPPAMLAAVAIPSVAETLLVGAQHQFTLIGTYSDGRTLDLTAQAVWASSTGAVATIDASGRATTVGPGTTTISATLGAMRAESILAAQLPATIAARAPETGVVGSPFSASLTAGGGTPPYVWSIAAGALPAGLRLDDQRGVIRGTPTTPGVSAVTVQVTAGSATATRTLTLSIGENEIVAENALPGSPPAEWDVVGAGDPGIQGFATDISVDQGGTVKFKIATGAGRYRIDVYRLGYYGGMGARRVATVRPSAALPQPQPNCLTQPATGLMDCGNWAVSASWTVPATATSGIYVARLVREDPEDGRASHVPFVVRDDDGGSDVLFQTADATWQAYNGYGGTSLYAGAAGGRAYKVSYNRPFTTRCCEFPNGARSTWLFNSEYPMVRWLERNGYDVSYFTGVDADRRGDAMLEHRVYMPVGHDEYWSGGQRAHAEAARDAGVHVAIFSGNHGFWKARWEPSIDGTGTPYRTLVCYKETEVDAKIDPLPGVWTGTWRDPRFGPHDGGRPENAFNGTAFTVNGIRNDPVTVPAADGRMRFWRNTSIATLRPGQAATLPAGVLGAEWDEDLDNGVRPAGLVRLSTTTVAGVQRLYNDGDHYRTDTATHHLTFYRAPSGALVFAAGTIQWPWGLDDHHDRPGTPVDFRMQQATLNLLADMSVQPARRQEELVPASASSDVTPPTIAITSPAPDAAVVAGASVTIAGTAGDDGGQVGGVEVSTDGGVTWHPASGRAAWTYVWSVAGPGPVTLRARAADDSGNLGMPASTTVAVAEAGATTATTPGTLARVAPAPSAGVPAAVTHGAAGDGTGGGGSSTSCAPSPAQPGSVDPTDAASCLAAYGTDPAAFGRNVHGKSFYLVPFSPEELRLVTGENAHRHLIDVVTDRWRAWVGRQPAEPPVLALFADGRPVPLAGDGSFAVPGAGAGTTLLVTTSAGDATAVGVR